MDNLKCAYNILGLSGISHSNYFSDVEMPSIIIMDELSILYLESTLQYLRVALVY